MPSRAWKGLFITLCMLAAPARATEPVDREMITLLRDEGFERSQVMATLEHLTETIGPRVTGSPGMDEANAWTRDRLAQWGLTDAHLEGFEFGHGWSFTRCNVHAVQPQAMPLFALPQAWTPGTEGVLRGEAVFAKIEDEKDLEPLRGTLAGKVVFVDDLREIEPAVEPAFERYDDQDLQELCNTPVSTGDRSQRLQRYVRFLKRSDLINAFLLEEGALAKVQVSSRDGGIVRVTRGASHHPQGQQSVPGLVMAAEHYDRVVRWLKAGEGVELEIDVDAAFHDEDSQAYNTVAEIRGGKKKDEVVLLGAHLDSWHAASGATDNAAGVAVSMEAVRILRAVGAKMDRTVRIVLWSGEEQGLCGSRGYVAQHFATRPDPPADQRFLPRVLQDETWPITPLGEHAKVAGYFNLDNGGGKIRGIYAEKDVAVQPVFEAWLEPFADLGAQTVSLRSTRGTDHVPFVEVGLPGFQFIQDPLAYDTRTHHTNLDTLDYVDEADLRQAAVIVASFVFHAANREHLLPRPPMPQPRPEETTHEDAVASSGER